jgi:hypothetical protein
MYSGLFMFMLELGLRDCVGGLEGAFPFVFWSFSGLCSIECFSVENKDD